MATQVVRVKSVKKLSKSHTAHVRGDGSARPKEAKTRAEWGNARAVILGGDELAATRLVRGAAKQKRPGRKAHEVVDVLFAGPPRFEAPDAWDRRKVEAWASASFEWMKTVMGPQAPVVAASLHLDELSPHVHASFIPVCGEDAKGPKLSWKTLQKDRFGGFSNSRKQLVWLQDDYQEKVGSKFGLERGGLGSGADHEEPDRVKGLKQRIEDEERLKLEALERAAKAERDVQELGRRLEESRSVQRRDETALVCAEEREYRAGRVAGRLAAVDRVVAGTPLSDFENRGRASGARPRTAPAPDRGGGRGGGR